MNDLPENSWKTEADLVRDFITFATAEGWVCYAETGNWDLVVVRSDGFQIGIEAKLSLNPKVVRQAIGRDRANGPDCAAVLVPKKSEDIAAICRHVGITVLTPHRYRHDGPLAFHPGLPSEKTFWGHEWYERAPDNRLKLPGYVPDVTAGAPAPLRLTAWKISAIKVSVFLEKTGSITRKMIRLLGCDPRRWTDGWLIPAGDGNFTRSEKCPDFRKQHPRNYVEIEADFEKWSPKAEELV